jgi:RNA polymerase sigma factor (TIGR02999 family)
VVFPDRNRFLGYASRAMRGLIIDYVRTRQAEKRGGALNFTTLSEWKVAKVEGTGDLEALGHALDELAGVDAGLAELVDLKFFCGFSFTEIAGIRAVSERTVQRDWAKARVLLHQLLVDED